MKLNLIDLVESPNCSFCQEAVETSEHLLFSCRVSSEFWKHVLSWLRDNDVHVDTIYESDVIFGKFDIVQDYIIINHILLLAKYYIHCRKCVVPENIQTPTTEGISNRTPPPLRIFHFHKDTLTPHPSGISIEILPTPHTLWKVFFFL